MFLLLLIPAVLFLAGCVQTSSSNYGPATIPATPVPLQVPSREEPAAADTVFPQTSITVIRYIPQIKDLHDPELLFAVRVPAEWNVSTWRLAKSDLPDYRTDLVADDIFVLYSYPASRSREQEYRDQFRQWSPAPSEAAVIINGTPYDRFERRYGGNVTVAYLMRTNSANERGYAGVLVFTARDSNRFELEDFENVVSSFRYYSRSSAASIPGEVIPLYDLSGTAVSRKETVKDARMYDSSDWDGGGSASDGVTSGQDSSGEPSSGGASPGGGCQR